MKKRSIHEALQVFDLRDLQAFRTLLMVIERNEISLDQVIRYTWFKTVGLQARLPGKRCPECSAPMGLYQVNHTSCTQVGRKWRSQWYCSDCDYSEFMRKSVSHVRHKLRKKLYPFLDDDRQYEKEALEWEIAHYLDFPITNVCPECKKTMQLHKVKTPIGKANVYGWKSVWFCDECGYEKYTTRTVKEEAVRLRRI